MDLSCDETTKRGIDWPRTKTGTIARRKCPESSEGTSTWYCTPEGRWLPEGPNTTTCESDWVKKRRDGLTDALKNKDASALPEMLRLLTVDSRRPMVAGDLPRLVSLLESVVETLSDNPWAADVRTVSNKPLVETVNVAIRSKDAWKNWDKNAKMRMATRLLNVVERAFISSSKHEESSRKESHSIVQPSVTVEMSLKLKASSQNSGYFMFPAAAIWGDAEMDSVNVPTEAFEDIGLDNAQVYFASFADLGEMMEPEEEKLDENNSGSGEVRKRKRKLVSRIVGATVIKDGKAKASSALQKPVVITFHHKPSDVRHMRKPECNFWNTNQLKWQSRGCSLKSHNDTATVCECSHMTHFAVLMDIYGHKLSEADDYLLTMLTYVGCSLSIVCLLLTFICFAVFSSGGGDRVLIHQNLCLTLGLAETIFLFGIARTEDSFECGLIAAGLLFFFLSALTWMLLEGYQLYQMLVEVFPTGSRKFIYLFIGYTFPAAVSGFAYYFYPQGFGTRDYCWLRTDNMFILVFVTPAAIILSLNTVFLFMTLCIIYRHTSGGYLPCRQDKDTTRSVRSWVKGAMALVCLLGVTWTLGLLWIDNGHSIIMAYAFTIANSLQGLFIFLFHVVFSSRMRKDILRWCQRRGCCSADGSHKESLPRVAMSPSNGSGTATEFLYQCSEKYSHSPRDLNIENRFVYSYGERQGSRNPLIHPASLYHHCPSHDCVPHYQAQQLQGGTYDYATISYGDMLPYRPPSNAALRSLPPDYRSSIGTLVREPYYGSCRLPVVLSGSSDSSTQLHRPPPKFSPPAPPPSTAIYGSQPRRPPSSDSAYSDGGSSSMLTTEVTPQGATVLRFDVRKPHMYSQQV
ncbi:hypothetical protein WR25_26683 isoform D [Diploscapter pachys]|nr:hypothetical protein WR25_26683 isoform B [Diploscapter pachys]PAV82556.1 hypothetical protein WR25_26683 isoform C [Diploscapter pachys]PAV82557.1 hypothetical protein WR25_26683 isoform D [Diploscapter pachys]